MTVSSVAIGDPRDLVFPTHASAVLVRDGSPSPSSIDVALERLGLRGAAVRPSSGLDLRAGDPIRLSIPTGRGDVPVIELRGSIDEIAGDHASIRLHSVGFDQYRAFLAMMTGIADDPAALVDAIRRDPAPVEPRTATVHREVLDRSAWRVVLG